LPVLYGCEKWSIILRVESGPRMFVNTVLRKIFGRKRENITGESVKLHNTEFHDMYSLPNIISDEMKESFWHKWEEEKCVWDLEWGDLKERDSN
jgi:hypothetical protein